jgi:hypothetical protein
MNHVIERTSPKGQKFVGTCILCGIAGLVMSDSLAQCTNPEGISQTEALLLAIDGPDSTKED